MRQTKGWLFSAILSFAGIALSAQAGTWSASEHTAQSGDLVTVDIRFTGDGVTSGTQVSFHLDSTRLTIEAPAGPLPDANRAGMCGWDGWGAVSTLYSNLGGGTLPQTDTLVCQFSVRVRPNARAGHARIFASGNLCVRTNGTEAPCPAEEGGITVEGTREVAVGYEWTQEETLELEILMPEEESEKGIAATVTSSDLWRRLQRLGLLNGNRPGQLRRFMGRSMTPSEAEYYRLHPQTAGAHLHRLLIASFANPMLRDRALAELAESPVIERVAIRRISSQRQLPREADKRSAVGDSPTSKSSGTTAPQEHLDMLNAREAIKIAGGWGLVAVVDTGIEREHSEFKSFSGDKSLSGSFVPGGNYLPYFSVNLAPASTLQPGDDVDEALPSYAGEPGTVSASCDPNNDGLLEPPVGHGTHVTGLIAANGRDNAGVSGVCKDCGLAVAKVSWNECVLNQYRFNLSYDLGLASAIAMGAQVINLSGGSQQGECRALPNEPYCVVTAHAFDMDIFVAAASGNRRLWVQGPADSANATAVGGVDQAGVLWDEYPGESCGSLECGSNYTLFLTPGWGKQELVTLSRQVVSTTYHGVNWTDDACGDSVGPGEVDDGIGLCTGTSMSAPQVAGLVGIMRSINPLVRVGVINPLPPDLPGIRHLLASTASLANPGPQWDQKLGHGEPDATAAVRGMLGTSNEELVRNRAIPLFSLLHSKSGDYAAVATPQLAMALHGKNYSADGGAELAVPSYPAFPHGGKGQPRARVYVLSTEHRTMASTLPLEPLYLMVKRDGNGNAMDHVLVTGSQNVQAAANANPPYVYAGRQGYIYRDCDGQPGCTPPVGTELLHLKCNAQGRCAVFPQGDDGYFVALGYNTKAPWMPNSRLGFAYSRGDTDGDGLPDAAEHVLGTSPYLTDTDGDGVSDGVEYPFNNLPNTDPCDGPLREQCALSEWVFSNGFEG